MMVSSFNNGDCVRVTCEGKVVAERVRLLLSGLSRLKGLLGTRRLDKGNGVLLAPCNSVHMFGMLYSIDVLFLDKEQRVVNMKQNVKPFWFAMGGPSAYSTIELPATSLAGLSVSAGDKVTLEHCQAS